MILALYFLAAFGLAYVVGFATITRTPREMLAIYALGTDGGKTYPLADFVLSLIECPMCFGWWTGLAAGVVAWRLGIGFDLGGLPGAWPFVLPFATAGSNMILGTYVGIVDLHARPLPPETP